MCHLNSKNILKEHAYKASILIIYSACFLKGVYEEKNAIQKAG